MENNSFEYFVIKKIRVRTNIDNCHFCMPSNDSLTYFLNDITKVLDNQIKNNTNNNYLTELSKLFYAFLEKDTVLRDVDSLCFSKLLLTIKGISEGNPIDKKSVLEYLTRVKIRYMRPYLSKVIQTILSFQTDFENNIDSIDAMVDLFFNELLAKGIDVRFINRCTGWYKTGQFKNIQAFFRYFLDSNSDSYDIYLPIKDITLKNRDIFEQAGQEVVEIDDKLYLHVFKNLTIDYVSVIKTNMIRIESIFNMLKLYTRSSISFDLLSESIVKIRSTVLNVEFESFSLRDIVRYEGVKPYSRYMKQTLDNLYNLESVDRSGYHKLLNIIAYSEKDDDYINPTSFVDAWIALETLFSLSGAGKGIEVVKRLLPMLLSSKIIINKLTYCLQKAFPEPKCKAEDFILKKPDLDTIDNIYYKYELQKFSDCFSNIKNLSKLYATEENKIRTNLLRIYMLRNEYVHESDLNAYSSLQFYYLKNYLTMSIDMFFSMLDKLVTANLQKEEKQELIYCVFERLIEKNEDRQVAFDISNMKKKYNNGNNYLAIDEVEKTISLEEMVLNIILNNKAINKKFEKRSKHNALE